MEPSTEQSLVAAASTLINTHCRRETFAINQYTERIRIAPGRNDMQLTYLPLAIAAGATSPLVSGRARYGMPRRGEDTTLWDMMSQIASAFQLPGTWIDVDVSTFDYFADNGRGVLAGQSPGSAVQRDGAGLYGGIRPDSRPGQVRLRADCAQSTGQSGAEREGGHTERDAAGIFLPTRCWTPRCRPCWRPSWRRKWAEMPETDACHQHDPRATPSGAA